VQPRAPEGRRVGGQGGQHRRVSRPDLLQEQSVHHPGRFHEAGERLAFARGQLRDRRRDVGRREPRRHPSQFLQPRQRRGGFTLCVHLMCSRSRNEGRREGGRDESAHG